MRYKDTFKMRSCKSCGRLLTPDVIRQKEDRKAFIIQLSFVAFVTLLIVVATYFIVGC